jgi:hypothetical protein
VDDNHREDVVRALAAAGIEVERELDRGRLYLLSAREYCPIGEFDPREMLARFRELGSEVARSGTEAARAAVEMTWALTLDVPLDRLAEYECWGNHIFEHFTGISLCMYNRRRFPVAAMEGMLRAHPSVVLDGEVAPNPFYEPPEICYAGEPAEVVAAIALVPVAVAGQKAAALELGVIQVQGNVHSATADVGP